MSELDQTRDQMRADIRPILVYVDPPIYRAIFLFEYIAKKVVDREWGRSFDKAFEVAMRTAK